MRGVYLVFALILAGVISSPAMALFDTIMLTAKAPSGSGPPPPGSALCTTVTPPPGAVAAGFNTLAGCWDFTQNTSTNSIVNGVSSTIDWSNLSSWLDCIPSDGAVHPFYFGAQPSFRTDVAAQNPPCSSVAWANDPLTGTKTMTFTWLSSYGNFYTSSATYYNLGIGIGLINNAGTHWLAFPANSYVRATYRLSTISGPPDNYSGFYNVTQTISGSLNNGGGTEFDDIETVGSCLGACYDSAIHNTASSVSGYVWNGATASLGAGYTPVNYHSYDLRVTSDGSSSFAACSYVDTVTPGTPTLIACRSNPDTPRPNQYQQYSIHTFDVGCAQRFAGPPGCQPSNPGNMVGYLTDIEIWTCNTSGNTYCTGTTLTGPP